jgi:peroxiredoxin Q/BCP
MGVSPDSLESHRKFKRKHELPYPLLVDADHGLADSFGIWKEKSMYGLKYMGVERTTVIIDRGGRVARIFPKVQIPGHVQEVEKAVRELA